MHRAVVHVAAIVLIALQCVLTSEGQLGREQPKENEQNETSHSALDFLSRFQEQSKSAPAGRNTGSVGNVDVYIATQFAYYHKNDETRTWDESQQYCKSLGMQLVTIDSKEKFNMVTQLIRDIGDSLAGYWTAGVRNTETGDWYWSTTGEKLKFTAWGEDEPTPTNDALVHWCNTDCMSGRVPAVWLTRGFSADRPTLCELVAS